MAQPVGKSIRTQQAVEKIGALRWEQIKAEYHNSARRFGSYDFAVVLADYYEFAQLGEEEFRRLQGKTD